MSDEQALSFGSLSIRAGDVIAGKYRVERAIAQGGMGVVLLATHVDLQTSVALKLLLPELGGESDVVERFIREAQLAARIRSEHIVRIMDVGRTANGEPYMAMELLEGKDLSEVLDRRGTLVVSTAVDYLLQACDALAEAHALGVVHRDLKPSNLFVTHRRDGTALVKVLDFGVSKLTKPLVDGKPADQITHSMSVIGTPRYMSPEQISRPKQVDARSDIWTLGVILYELISGQVPFRGETLTELMISIAASPPIPLREVLPDAAESLWTVLQKCLEKNAASRYSNVAEFAAAIAPFGSPNAPLLVQRLTSNVAKISTVPPPALPSSAIPDIPGAPPVIRNPTSPTQPQYGAESAATVATTEPIRPIKDALETTNPSQKKTPIVRNVAITITIFGVLVVGYILSTPSSANVEAKGIAGTVSAPQPSETVPTAVPLPEVLLPSSAASANTSPPTVSVKVTKPPPQTTGPKPERPSKPNRPPDSTTDERH